MKRGEVWTVAAAGDMSKPRPVVIVQAERLDRSNTVVICPLTSFESDGATLIEPSATNGLISPSAPMAWKMAAVKKARLGKQLGCFSDGEMEIVAAALRETLGL